MKQNKAKWQRIALVCLLSGVTGACSSFTTKQALTETEVCVQLNALVADHSQNFKQFKRQRLSSRYTANAQIWAAEQVFPLAKNCQVWEWSTGLQTYICHWKSKTGEQEARESYDQGIVSVRQCLDQSWARGTVATKSGGERAFFIQEHSNTVIAVRYFKEARTILESWQTTLSVGDASNLKAGVQ